MEEDIKILEEIVENYKDYFCENYEIIADMQLRLRDVEAIQNIIARYKELEENLNYRIRYCYRLEKELYGENAVELTKLEDKYYIPKSKVKEKIKEWDESIKWANADDRYYAIKILKELLEES